MKSDRFRNEMEFSPNNGALICRNFTCTRFSAQHMPRVGSVYPTDEALDLRNFFRYNSYLYVMPCEY